MIFLVKIILFLNLSACVLEVYGKGLNMMVKKNYKAKLICYIGINYFLRCRQE